MLKVVLTGGPLGGKTTVLDQLMREYRNRAVRVVDAAALLVEGGFPIRESSPGWTIAFRRTVAATQLALEAVAQAEGAKEGMDLLLIDGGLVDGAAHLGSLEEVALLLGVRPQSMLAWYDVVIHLESLAVARPEEFRTLPMSAPRALEVELALRRAWCKHPRRVTLGYYPTIDEKARAASNVIRIALAHPVTERAA